MHLLNQVKVRDNQRPSQQLQLRFKGLSDFYVPYFHTYSSVPLDFEHAKELIQVINNPFIGHKSNPFYPYKDSAKLVQEYFNIVQIKAPRRLSRDFQKLKLRRGEQWLFDTNLRAKKIFRGKYFDRQARWNLEDEENYLQPGSLIETEDWLVDILQKKKELDVLNAKLERKRRYDYKNISQGERASLGRKINELRRGKKFNSEYDELMEQILQKQNSLEEILEQGDLFYNKRKKSYELFLDERPKLEFQRQLSYEEWMNLTHMFFDIETPKFMENDYDVTQVAACIMKNHEITSKLLFSKVLFHKNAFMGHQVFSGYDSDYEMIRDISNYALINDVDCLWAYNINFDASYLRERGDFRVGEADLEPKKEVTKKFFERFRMDGGFCFDLLRVMQTLLRGFPNAKLEMSSRFFKGDKGYKKIIHYDEIAEIQYYLEEKRELSDKLKQQFSIKNREDANEVSLKYVGEDTLEMPSILSQTLFETCMRHGVWMAENFKISFPKITYSPMSLREVFDRGYFKHMGIQRDEIYPKGIKWFQNEIEKNKKAVKNFMDSVLDFERQEGTFHYAERRMLATAYLIRTYLSQKTHSVKNFMNYIENLICDEHEFIFLSHYVNGLSDYVLNDFGDFLRKEEEFEKIKMQYSDIVGLIHRSFNRDEVSFELAIGAMDEIVRRGFFEKNGYKKIKARDLNYLKDFNQFKEAMDDKGFMLESIIKNCNLTNLDLYRIFWTGFNKRNSIARNHGNHLVHPYLMKKTMEIELLAVKKKLEDFGKVLSVRSPYLYILPNEINKQGETIIERANNSRLIFNCPCQNVISSVFISDKEYSREEGFYKGIKIKDGAGYYVNAFYSRIYARALEKIWNKDYKGGISEILKGYDVLRKWNVSNEDLIFFNKTKKYYFGFKGGEMYKFRVPGEIEDEIPVHKVEDFTPDYGSYVYDYSQRMKKFLKPILKYVDINQGHMLKAMMNTRKPKIDDGQLEFDLN